MKTLSNGHAVHSIGYHIVFCTKYRRKVLTDSVEVELKRVLAEACALEGWILHSMETMPDHVHLFIQTDHLTAPVGVAKTLKSVSAVRIFSAFPKLKARRFWGSGLWSRGTYFGTVGHVSEETVKKYIDAQKTKR
jgi:putative transposase